MPRLLQFSPERVLLPERGTVMSAIVRPIKRPALLGVVAVVALTAAIAAVSSLISIANAARVDDIVKGLDGFDKAPTYTDS